MQTGAALWFQVREPGLCSEIERYANMSTPLLGNECEAPRSGAITTLLSHNRKGTCSQFFDCQTLGLVL